MPPLQHNVFITSYNSVWLKYYATQYVFIYRKHIPISYRIGMLNGFMKEKKSLCHFIKYLAKTISHCY